MARGRLRDRERFRSLQTRNYRLFFIGQLVSTCGTWMQSLGLGWLVLDLSHESSFAVGAVFALQYLPSTLLSAWSGVVADRLDKRRVLVVSQAVLAVSAAVLGIVTLAGIVELWMVAILAIATGAATAFDNPARQSFTVEMVGEEDLPNAVGLTSALFQLSRIVGPALAGLTIATLGTGACFVINAASYVAVICALSLMHASELHRHPPVPRQPRQVRDGFRYCWANPLLRYSLLLILVVGTFALNHQVILPLLARLTFDGGPATLAVLGTSLAAGSFAGALYVAGRRAKPGAHFAARSSIGFGVCTTLTACAPWLLTAVVCLFLTGFFMIGLVSTLNSLVQLESDPAMRGRVMGVWTVMIIGSTPIGGPLIGALSEAFDTRVAVGLSGIVTVVAAFVYLVLVDRSTNTGDATVARAGRVRRQRSVPTELLGSD